MTIVDVLNSVQPYHWLALGLILLVVELTSGTTYLLWPAAAAGVTGLVALVAPTNWAIEFALFAVLVIALTFYGRPLVQRLRQEAHHLNERGAALIGQRGAAAGDFINGVGSVRIQDSVWRAMSDETIAEGAEVEVTAVDGVTLKVKRA